MQQFQIDKNKPIPKLELSLHKPNEEQVGSLTDAYERSGTFSYGRYNELDITVPKIVTRKHKQVPYKEFDLIRDKYLVKATYGGLFSEYLVVTKIHKSKSGIPTKRVTLRSRQYELNGKILRGLELLSYTVREAMEVGLKNTNWTIGTIDPDLELIINEDGSIDNPDKIIPRRSFEETKITSLNFLYRIAETFGVILQFDTFNRTVSVLKPENAEIDKGLTASYGKYIKSLDEDIDAESVITRLFVYGKDNLTINEASPTGQSYIEDYSHYMQGYKTDELGNVISSSPYMSDELCQAIIDYNLLLIEKEGYFKLYLDQLKPIEEDWVNRLSELYTLETDLAIIQDNLDIAKASEEDTTLLKQQLADKEIEIANKQAEIDDLELQMQMIENDIQDLRTELSLENNFTPEQIDERNDYIADGEWTDGNYFDVNELYEKGKEIMKKMREPKRDLDMSLVQFLNTVESQRDWNRIGLGYTIHTHYEPLDVEFKALISEIRIGFDNNDLGIAISNVDYKSDKDAFLNMLYGTAVSTADRLNQKEKDWSDNIDRTDYLAEFLENPWDTSRQRIIAGVDETVSISRRGIIIRNPRFPNERLHATAGVLALSLDDGETWSTAISPYGVAAEVLIGKAILGEKLEIGDDEGTFNIKGNLLTIKDRNEITRLRLGEYTSNKFGLQLMNKSGQDVVLSEDGLLQMDTINKSDNVDSSHGLTLYVYIPDRTLEIRDARLNFRLLPFRSYAGTTKSGGQYIKGSTAVGSSTENGGQYIKGSTAVGDSTSNGGQYVKGSTSEITETHNIAGSALTNSPILPDGVYPGDTNHWHSIDPQWFSHRHNFTSPGFTVPSHKHSFSVNIPAINIPSHKHSFSVNIPSISIPDHTHDILHGIFVGTFATGVGVIINGIDRTAQLGGKFTTSQANLSVGNYLEVGKWNEIELTSDTLGRIDANIYFEIFTSTE